MVSNVLRRVRFCPVGRPPCLGGSGVGVRDAAPYMVDRAVISALRFAQSPRLPAGGSGRSRGPVSTVDTSGGVRMSPLEFAGPPPGVFARG
jgi:hypothetical protein